MNVEEERESLFFYNILQHNINHQWS